AQEAAWLLRNHDREQGLALGAEVGPLCDVAQAVEVHVSTALDRDEALAFPALAGHIFLDAGNRQGPGRLEDRTCVLEDVLDRGADLVRVQQQDLVNMGPAEPERLLANALHGNAVGKNAHALERDAPAGP